MIYHDVVRFDISVHNALAMAEVQGLHVWLVVWDIS